eukprot:178842-Prymnesium_polylepis.1
MTRRELCAEAHCILLERDAQHACHRHLARGSGVESSRTHPSAANERPLHAARCRRLRPLRQRERIKTRVARRVVGLPNIAQTSAHRRKEHQRVERRALCSTKHKPRAKRLRGKQCRHASQREVGEQAL